MSDPRQMPLLPSEPSSPDDLNKYTPLKYARPLFAEHLRAEGKSDHTVRAFLADLNLLAEHADEMRPLGEFQTSTLNQFLDWLENGRGVPCSQKSYARRVTTLKVFFRWLKSIDAIGHDPSKAVVQRSGPAPLSYALSPDEVDAMFDFARSMTRRKGERDTRPELLFWLLLDTGIKKSEASRLTLFDVKRNADPPYLHVHHTSRNVYKERKIEIDPAWIDLLDEYALQYEVQERIFDCTPRNLEYVLEDVSTGAGIPTKVSFEIMRWSSALRGVREGEDEDRIRERMGLSRVSWQETNRKVRRLLELEKEKTAKS